MRILVAPLDWGLGHTTRCVPIINYLRAKEAEVIVAGNEVQLSYIKSIFPAIDTVFLEGYNVRYSKSKKGFMPSLLLQLPNILRTIKQEHNWLKEIVAKQNIDAVISDNRYGLHHKDIRTAIMTHQVQPISGMGSVIDGFANKWHNIALEKFKECWVVDTEHNGLAGALSHPSVLPKQAKYIGLLSQLGDDDAMKDSSLVVLLSGPEPQRTILSKQLWQQLQSYKGKVTFIEGNMKATEPSIIPSNIAYYKRVNGAILTELIASAALVICRSGYSTLMDLVKLGKKAILIPTPGQTEQEYLADYLFEEGVFYKANQAELDILYTIDKAQSFHFKQFDATDSFEQYQTVIDDWMK